MSKGTVNNSSFIIVLCTVPDEKNARHISQILVDEKLAACCNIISGLKSVYFWENKRQEESEILLLIKSRRDLFTQLENRIRSEHPYSVPEIIALPVIDGNREYLNWVDDNVKKS